ncbi:hypothetical protein EON83_04355 [bacterium]|nr:MAG: hypothetical protein EON83_04355 [bacterium]
MIHPFAFKKSLTLCLSTLAALCLLLALTKNSVAASPPGDIVGKVTVGYQGWFWATGDGTPWTEATKKFFHFNPEPGIEADTKYRTVEMWPDMREYTTSFPTSLAPYGNGQPATMFSSYSDQTVQTHFRWMKENGINTAALQRFGGEVCDYPVVKATRDAISVKVMNAAQAQGRKFYIMYDCSGWQNFQQKIKTDWTDTIVGALHLTSSPAYAKQNGKPVVCIWGLGYAGAPTTGPGNPELSLDVVNWFKANGCYVIGGFPGQWRSGTGDSRPDFKSVYSAVDMIAPWGVGGIPNYDWTKADLVLANEWGKDYQPMAYPGTSFFWGNRSGKNLFPRNHGDFMWGYFKNYRQLGIQTCYIAMFDEIDEGTAIFKVAEDASMQPTNQWFLPLDADGVHCSSDFYLRLTNDGGRMIRGELPFSEQHPTLHVPSASGPIINGTYEIQPVSSPAKRLDIEAAADADGAKVQLWSTNGGPNQAMNIVPLGGDNYEITPLCAPTRRIQVGPQGIDIRQSAPGPSQRWKIEHLGEGIYELSPLSSPTMRLAADKASDAPSANIQLALSNGGEQQKWRIIPTIVPDAIYQLEPQCAPGKRLTLAQQETANGTAACISTADDTPTQNWKITASGANYYELSPVNTAQRLDVMAQQNADGTKVNSWEITNSPAQKWRLLDIGGGLYELEPQCAPGKRLDVVGGATANGTAVEIWQVKATPQQRWKLIAHQIAK